MLGSPSAVTGMAVGVSGTVGEGFSTLVPGAGDAVWVSVMTVGDAVLLSPSAVLPPGLHADNENSGVTDANARTAALFLIYQI